MIAASPFAIALWKWGTTSLLPLDIHMTLMNEPERASRTNGQFVQWPNLIFALEHYFTVFSMKAANVFPYFEMGPWEWGVEKYEGVRLDGGEPFLSLPVSVPLFLLLSLCGCVAMLRREWASHLRVPVLGAFCGSVTVFIVAGITHRYIHDFWPFLITASSVGVAFIWRARRVFKILAGCLSAILIVYGSYVNFGAIAWTFLITDDFYATITKWRLDLDGKRVDGMLLPVTNDVWLNGVRRAKPHNQIMVWWDSGFQDGVELTFSSSGKRTITGHGNFMINQNMATVVELDVPIDPKKDGFPNLIQYKTLKGTLGHKLDHRRNVWR
jgi:hypothetical protein